MPLFRGAEFLYVRFVEPFLRKNEQKIDEGISEIGERAKRASTAVGKAALNAALNSSAAE